MGIRSSPSYTSCFIRTNFFSAALAALLFVVILFMQGAKSSETGNLSEAWVIPPPNQGDNLAQYEFRGPPDEDEIFFLSPNSLVVPSYYGDDQLGLKTIRLLI